MIERAVFSYFNPDEKTSNRCGFTKFSDFLFTTALSVHCASKLFKEVAMVSTDWGLEIFKEIGLPITEYSNSINSIKEIPRQFWAYGKMIAYCEQKKPFVHIDNDVFMWEKLPDRILNAEFCFQSWEPMDEEYFKYYHLLREPWINAPIRPQKIVENEVYDYAYNCGICGGHNLDFYKEWKECSTEYIFAPENQKTFFEDFLDVIQHQNLFHEQYFAACLIQMHKKRAKVEVIHQNGPSIPDVLKYTHLWGTTKRDVDMMRRVYLRLHMENRRLHQRVEAYCKKNNII